MRRTKLWCALGFLALAAPLACGKSASSTGSNTNWLRHCDVDSDCSGRNECWCHACTAVCASDAACGHGSCRAPSELGCASPSTSGGNVCVSVCTTNTDCASENASCVNGACIPAEAAGSAGGAPSGAGAAGGKASGGTGGTDANAGMTNDGTAGEGGTPVPTGKSVAVGPQRTCVVTDGQLYCWGSNWFGETGVPNADDVPTPTLVPGLGGVVAVALAADFSCALTNAGAVYCFGQNASAELGSPSDPAHTCWDHTLDSGRQVPCETAPVRVPNLDTAVEVAVGTAQSCARLADGSLRCWGDVGAIADWAASVTNATGIALGSSGACATLGDGALSCSFAIPNQAMLPAVSGVWLEDASSSPGDSPFQCVLDLNGNARCFGAENLGQPGVGTLLTEQSFPAALSGTRALTVGSAHVCALATDASVACWGRNTYGAVGSPPLTSPVCGSETCERSPRAVSGLPAIASIDASGDRTCALAADGTLFCWGGGAPDFGAPVRVPGPWESATDACLTATADAAQARADAYANASRECVTDADCAEVALDLSCEHTCATAALSRTGVDSFTTALAAIENDACARSAAAACVAAAPSCPEQTLSPTCDGGGCTLADPTRSKCSDACACFAQRAAASATFVSDCQGFDLWASVGWSCAACDHSAVYVVVTNAGSARFQGDARVSFGSLVGGTPVAILPEPVTVSLELAPGQSSEPIRIESKAPGEAMIVVTADGDCQPLNDASTEVTLPSPANDCAP